MEEKSWSSCGNRDYLTPWDLSSLSTKSSPMLSMMLGVEGEDGPSSILEVIPSCVWISSSMCLHLCCLNFPSTSSWTKSWSQSLLHVVVASFNSSLSHCCLIFTNFFLSISRTEPVLKHCPIAKCTNFPFQRVLIRPKLIPNKRVMSILSQRCNLPWRISERATFNFLVISPCTGLQIHWSWMCWNGNLMELLNINFLLLVELWTWSQIDENCCLL